MSTKFEQLLDYLVNENMEKANELFHEIVVEKSRSIYENLIAEDDEEDMDESMDEENMDESEEDMDEFEEDLEDSYSMEADEEDGMSPHDASDDLGMDTMDLDGEDDGKMGDDEGDEDSAIYDIKNAIEELEAAFEKLEQTHGAGHDDMDADSEFDDEPEFDDSDSEFGGEEDEMEMMGSHAFENRRMTREYVEKVQDGSYENSKQKSVKNAGANSGDSMSLPGESKSMKWGNGKPTSGANAGNLAQGGVDGQSNTGTSPAKVNKGINPEKSEQFTGKDWETNSKPGGKAGVKNLKKVGSGYPGNNKSAGPVGSGTGDKAGQTSVSSDKPFLKKL